MIKSWAIEHDEAHDNLDCWMSQISNVRLVKEHEKQDIHRDNKHIWRLVKKKRDPKIITSKTTQIIVVVP